MTNVEKLGTLTKKIEETAYRAAFGCQDQYVVTMHSDNIAVNGWAGRSFDSFEDAESDLENKLAKAKHVWDKNV